MHEPLNVAEALELARQSMRAFSDTPLLDAQVLLAEVTKRSRPWVIAHGEDRLNQQQSGHFRSALERCRAGEPLPYILGRWPFFGRDFAVSPQVLIPRPETELMVERALSLLAGLPGRKRLLELGTGSGCVAVSLAAGDPELQVIATDISLPALSVARRNAQLHQVDGQVRFLQVDMAEGLLGPFELVCANLPYIGSSELPSLTVYKHEPRIALDGGIDGLALIKRLIARLPDLLASGGWALLEIGMGHAQSLSDYLIGALPKAAYSFHSDLAGHDRLLALRM